MSNSTKHPVRNAARALPLVVLVVLGLAATPPASAFARAGAVAVDVALDCYTIHLGGARGASPAQIMGDLSTIILQDDAMRYELFASFFDLETNGGTPRGNPMRVDLGSLHKPADLLLSEHFLPNAVIILSRDLVLTGIPFSFSADGTPVAGNPISLTIANTIDVGNGTALAEMPGIDFTDGMPRLVAGTDQGYLLVIEMVGGNPAVTIRFSLGSEPIDALGAIPQLGYMALGAAMSDHLIGLDLEPGKARAAAAAVAPVVIFSLAEPRPDPLGSFGVFEPNDQPLDDPTATVALAYTNGSAAVYVGKLPATVTGAGELIDFLAEPRPDPVVQLALGSLLTLSADGLDVLYDPGFEPQTGGSGCSFAPRRDAYVVGDVISNGALTSADIIGLVNFIFKGGAAPCPLYIADTDCSGAPTSADIIRLVNHVFKGGQAPCTP
jgi:hypothetical protein